MQAKFVKAMKRFCSVLGYYPGLSLPQSLEEASLADFKEPVDASPDSYERKRYWVKRRKLAWKIVHMLEETEGTKLDYVTAREVGREEGPHFFCSQCGGDILLDPAFDEEERLCENCGYDLLAEHGDREEVILKALKVIEEQYSGP